MRNNWAKAVAIGILFGAQMAVAAESGILLTDERLAQLDGAMADRFDRFKGATLGSRFYRPKR